MKSKIQTYATMLVLAAVVLAALTVSSVRGVATAPTPYINSIGGDTYSSSGVQNGLVNMSCGSSYNGARVVNNSEDTYSWIIYGGNFGSSQGSVTLAGRTAKVTSWSTTKIVVYPSVPYNSGPTSAILKINASTGSVSWNVSIVPAIKSRVYGQCTFHVAYKRLTLNLSPSPSAYGNYSSFTTSTVPRVGDQLQWNGTHTAIITAVNAYYDGGWSRYNIQVSEQNYDCRNSTRTFWDYFEVGVVSGTKKITHYITHPSMGRATLYYR